MGLLKSLFGDGSSEPLRVTVQWIPLTDIRELDMIVAKSHDKTQAIFKHSTRCGVSSSVLNRFERANSNDEIDFYYLDLLSYRAVSDEIATRFQVWHESPQLLVIKNGEVVAHGSHHEIMNIAL
ncbi:MAG: bacillithiol system redox-active protein YtxJ [Flavobacteriaceae bacterium]|nr:bacillithiol system redox-active protein YtxJ [Flavobacteriaceae bacterium]